MSQAGVLGLTKTFAREFASRNITSNAIAPGFIASEMTAKIDKKYEEQILAQIPLGKPAQPSLVAMASLHLQATSLCSLPWLDMGCIQHCLSSVGHQAQIAFSTWHTGCCTLHK